MPLTGQQIRAAAEALYESRKRPGDPSWQDCPAEWRVALYRDVVVVAIALRYTE